MANSLAEIVIAEKLVSHDELRNAADAADSQHLPLVVPLIRDFGVDEIALTVALKKHLRIKTLDPGKIEFDSDALRQLSLGECRRLRAAPFSISLLGVGGKHLCVAMADPTDTVGLAELDHLSGCTVEPVLAPLSTVEEMIETGYRQFVTEVMKRPGTSITGKAPIPTAREASGPITAPFHRIADEANASIKIEALISLCVEKGWFPREEFEEMVLKLLKRTKN